MKTLANPLLPLTVMALGLVTASMAAMADEPASTSPGQMMQTPYGPYPGMGMMGGYGPGMMGPGMMGGYGPGMMGPGMMGGYGPGMMGPGMMGGYGPGMMGPGMMGGYGPGMMGPGMMGGYGPGMMGPGAQYGLDEAQSAQLEKLRTELMTRQRSLMERIWAEQKKLAELSQADKPDSKAVGKSYAAIADLQRQALEARIEAAKKADALLNKEQRARMPRGFGWHMMGY